MDDHYIYGTLSRSRWFGWETVDRDTYSKGRSNFINLLNRHGCAGTEHHYRLYNYSESHLNGTEYWARTTNETEQKIQC